jgi:hypothetical protein
MLHNKQNLLRGAGSMDSTIVATWFATDSRRLEYFTIPMQQQAIHSTDYLVYIVC